MRSSCGVTCPPARLLTPLPQFPPNDMKHLHYIGRSKGLLTYDMDAGFKREKIIEHRDVIFGSSLHLEDPDIKGGHASLLKAKPYEVRLEAGDTLYLPAYWHHEVRSDADARDGLSVAVNHWFANATVGPAWLEEDGRGAS